MEGIFTDIVQTAKASFINPFFTVIVADPSRKTNPCNGFAIAVCHCATMYTCTADVIHQRAAEVRFAPVLLHQIIVYFMYMKHFNTVICVTHANFLPIWH